MQGCLLEINQATGFVKWFERIEFRENE
jgi:hypothetical protein